MKLSIITINYNDVKGLKRTFNSVQSQKNHEFEYIVVDGLSNDGSVELIDQYNSIISKSICEKDTGIFNAMNKGIALAEGDYCLFLNSGDYLVSESVIDNVIPTLDGTDFISGDTICVSPIGKKKLWRAPRVLSVYVLTRYALSHQATFIRTNLLKKRPYREDLKIASDWEQELYELVFHDATYKFIPVSVCYFFEDGISRTNIEKVTKERDKVYSEYFSNRLLQEILGANELAEIQKHVEEGSSLYKCLLFGSKIIRKIHNLFSNTL